MSLSSFALLLIARLGVFGVGIAVFLNGLGVPGLSEVLLPLGGVGVRQGKINAPELILVTFICQVIGVVLAYFIARFGGVILVERYGKYLLISTRELKATHRLFEKYGNGLVAVGAFIPGPQGFIGYAAGIAQMNFWHFLISALVGKLVWVCGMIYLGYVLGSHLQLIDRLVTQTGALVLAILVVLAIWYVRSQRKYRRQMGGLQKENE